MSLINSLPKFARSPAGRRAADKAMRFANSPEGKRKLASAREQLAKRRKPR